MGNPYGTRDLVAVQALPAVTWKYGFFTNANEADKSALGHVAGLVNGEYLAGLVLGANAPRPAKATKKRATGSQSSYCDIDKINDAKAAGWKITSRPKIRFAGKYKLVKAYYVTIAPTDSQGQASGATIKYAFLERNSTLENVSPSDRTALGWVEATTGDKDLVWGARNPKPPLVSFELFPANGASSEVTVFADSSKLDSLPTGWKIASPSGYI